MPELLLTFLGFAACVGLCLVLIQFKRRLSSTLLDMERKRQAKRELELGILLLGRGCILEADVRFGTALVLWPEIVDSFSEREQQRLMAELAGCGGGMKATELWLQLAERRHSRQRSNSTTGH